MSNPNISEIMHQRYTCKAFDKHKLITTETFAHIENVMRFAASSVNSQPWHYIIATSAEGKKTISQSTQGEMSYNEAKILNCSHMVVFCRQAALRTEQAESVLQQEIADGRHKNDEAIAMSRKMRNYYYGLHNELTKDAEMWVSKQVYLSYGMVMMAAATLGIDSCPMEGFDSAVLDRVLGLKERGLNSVVLLALGYRSAEDFNAKMPKSRLQPEQIITRI